MIRAAVAPFAVTCAMACAAQAEIPSPLSCITVALCDDDLDAALALHRTDLPAHRLALIPNGTAPDGALGLDGSGLMQLGGGTIVPTLMRHHCRNAVEGLS